MSVYQMMAAPHRGGRQRGAGAEETGPQEGAAGLRRRVLELPLPAVLAERLVSALIVGVQQCPVTAVTLARIRHGHLGC